MADVERSIMIRIANQRGMTLVELLVVIILVCLLITFLGTQFYSLQQKAKTAICANNLRHLGLHVFQFSTENNGDLLPTVQRDAPGSSGSGRPWFTLLNECKILPYSSWNQKSGSVMHCPSRTTLNPQGYRNSLPSSQYNAVHYGMNSYPGVGNLIMMNAPRKKFIAIQRPSQTLLITETDWFYLILPKYNQYRISPHEGCNMLFADGHVEFHPGELPVYSGLPDDSGTGEMLKGPDYPIPPFLK